MQKIIPNQLFTGSIPDKKRQRGGVGWGGIGDGSVDSIQRHRLVRIRIPNLKIKCIYHCNENHCTWKIVTTNDKLYPSVALGEWFDCQGTSKLNMNDIGQVNQHQTTNKRKRKLWEYFGEASYYFDNSWRHWLLLWSCSITSPAQRNKHNLLFDILTLCCCFLFVIDQKII